MAKKITITEKQVAKYNHIVSVLKRINKYQSPERLRKSSEREYGLEYEEALEMAYENVLSEARDALKGARYIIVESEKVEVKEEGVIK